MIRTALALILLLLASLAVPQAAQAAAACRFAEGAYVGVRWNEEANVPALVLEVSADCRYAIRLLRVAGRDTPLTPQIVPEAQLALLRGSPPYDKQHGCPYASREKVEMRDATGAWREAAVRSTDIACNIVVAYADAAGAEVLERVGVDFIDARLRSPGAAAPPSASGTPEAAPARQSAGESIRCTTGETIATVSPDDGAAGIKRAMIAEMTERFAANRIFVVFRAIRPGRPFTVMAPSAFTTLHADAKAGGTATPYRIEAAICGEFAGRPAERAEGRLDYFCYLDRADDFVCRP